MGTLRFGLRAFVVGLFFGLLLGWRPGFRARRALRARVLQLTDAVAERLALTQKTVSVPDGTGTRGA